LYYDVWLLTLQYHEYWWTSFHYFKVPVFREILPPSEQNRLIKTPSPHTQFWMNISRSIYIEAIFKSKSHSLKLFGTKSHPTTGYLDNRYYRELRSYLRHTEWQVGISLTFFFHFIYFLDFKFMSDLLHYKWEICIPKMTV
jgi:hypothetical protein